MLMCQFHLSNSVCEMRCGAAVQAMLPWSANATPLFVCLFAIHLLAHVSSPAECTVASPLVSSACSGLDELGAELALMDADILAYTATGCDVSCDKGVKLVVFARTEPSFSVDLLHRLPGRVAIETPAWLSSSLVCSVVLFCALLHFLLRLLYLYYMFICLFIIDIFILTLVY